MAACGSLQHIFEKPLPENPSLFSSWKRIQTTKSSHLDDSSSSSSSSSSFNEIFGELHFTESPPSSSSSSTSSFPVPIPSSISSVSSVLTELSPNVTGMDKYKSPITNYLPSNKTKHYRHSDSFSSMNSDSLSLCTEGLGSESFDDVEDLKSEIDNTSSSWQSHHHHRRRTSSIKHTQTEYLSAGESKRSRISGVEFPPPISCIGRTGKPWVCFKSYRNNGRFILKEVRIPTQEFLHACREDGRLKLQFIQSDDETIEEDEEEEEEEEEEDNDDLNISNEEDENDEKQENDDGRENRGESSLVGGAAL